MTEIPSCWEENVRKQEGQRPLKRRLKTRWPREVSIDVGAHRTEGGPPMRGERMIGA